MGIALETDNLHLIELDDKIADIFATETQFDFELDQLPVASTSTTDLAARIDNIRSEFNTYCKEFSEILLQQQNHGWSSKLSDLLDSYLKLDETGLTASQVLVKRLVHLPLFYIVQPLHDSTNYDWLQISIALRNIDWIVSIMIRILLPSQYAVIFFSKRFAWMK